MTAAREALIERYQPHLLAELQANLWKGDAWTEEDKRTHAFEVLYHAAKLSRALLIDNLDAVRELAADVGNCAAMAADAMGVLDRAAPPPGELRENYGGPGGEVGSPDLKKITEGWLDALTGGAP